MVARAVPGYSDGLKHLRNTHRERVPGRTQVPALFPPRAKKQIDTFFRFANHNAQLSPLKR
jgi:hypothetical protein